MVEKALCLSQHKAEPHLRRIVESALGMMLFGTPHLGVDLAAWAKAGAGLASLLRQNNSKIVEVLEPSSEMLADIRDGLGELFRIRYGSRDSLLIACFWEALPITGIGEVGQLLNPASTTLSLTAIRSCLASLRSGQVITRLQFMLIIW